MSCADIDIAFVQQTRAALNRDAEVQQAHRGISTLHAQSIPEHTPVGFSKRQVLQAAAAAALSKALEAVQHPATASASGLATNTSASCSLQTSSSGLQWCDVADGQGPYPIKGAFTKCVWLLRDASNLHQQDLQGKVCRAADHVTVSAVKRDSH